MIRQFRLNSSKAILLGLLITSGVTFTSCAPRYGCYYGMSQVPADTNTYTIVQTGDAELIEERGGARFETENTGFSTGINPVGQIQLCHIGQ